MDAAQHASARGRGLAARVKERARALGFELVGIADPRRSDHMPRLERWLADGWHGDMGYLARADAVRRRGDLRLTLESVRSVVVVAQNYYVPDPEGVPGDPSRGVIARYARGRDYHRVVRQRLRILHRWIEGEVGHGVRGRVYVDTGPILERELGQRAGLGWFGKNTMLIHPRRGSYFFLGVLLLELELPPDPAFVGEHCGSCRRCLDACPTGALKGYGPDGAPVMDARLCISYLTIEHRGPIPRELRPHVGNRIFGCDICQEVCPWNGAKFVEPAREPGYRARVAGLGTRASCGAAVEGGGGAARALESVLSGDGMGPPGTEARSGIRHGRAGDVVAGAAGSEGEAGSGVRERAWADAGAAVAASALGTPGTDGPSLVQLMTMSEAEWDAYSRGSAMRRARRAGFLRNVAVALGNWGSEEAVPALVRALEDPEPLVRGHAAWALGRIGCEAARVALLSRLAREGDEWVRNEIRWALGTG